ncbi:hypothetical protein C8R43DRAFT_953506 [Mycena crocata]|nr:hypothetical protein C8R43DRAFT_953506 [Mycena crocata]
MPGAGPVVRQVLSFPNDSRSSSEEHIISQFRKEANTATPQTFLELIWPALDPESTPESDPFPNFDFPYWQHKSAMFYSNALRQRVRVVLKYTAKIELPQSLFVGGSLTKESTRRSDQDLLYCNCDRTQRTIPTADLGAQSYGTFGATATELEERFQLKDSGFVTKVPLGLGNCDRTRRTIPTADLGAQSYGTFV